MNFELQKAEMNFSDHFHINRRLQQKYKANWKKKLRM